MTRFWITLEQGIRFVLRCAEQMHGGEVFVPKIPSMKITDLAEVIAPRCQIEVSGIRPGEKVHEVLVAEDEGRNTLEFEDMFVITPIFQWWTSERWQEGKSLPEGFRYASENNPKWLSHDELRLMIKEPTDG